MTQRIEKSKSRKILLSMSSNASFEIFTMSSFSRSLHILWKFGVLGYSSFAAMIRQPTAIDPRHYILLSPLTFLKYESRRLTAKNRVSILYYFISTSFSISCINDYRVVFVTLSVVVQSPIHSSSFLIYSYTLYEYSGANYRLSFFRNDL